MRQIVPDDVKLRLLKEEADPYDIPRARKLLEQALTLQYRVLADGLIADKLFSNKTLSTIDWWWQYNSRTNTPEDYALSFEDPRVLEYKEQVIEAIGSRRVLPIRPQQLSGCLVSIYGGEICCWQDGRVNSQLAVLGSSYRLIAVNSSHARLDRLRNYIGSKVDQSSIDTRFIFGSVGPISVFANAALFEYKTERAVSPHLSANAAAFAEDARIVLRPIGPDSIANDDSDFFTAGTRVHEATHVWQHGRSMSAGKHEVASWHDGIREDLCRFLQMPRRIDEIHKIFEPQFNPVELHELAKTPIPEEIKSDRLHWAEYAVPRIDHGYTLETDLQDMLKMRLIVKHADGRFYCPIFEKGKRWILV